jgi:glutaminyl-tRNA synthetase
VILTNYPQGQTETLTAAGHPNRDDLPERSLPFGREIIIDQEDFREEANKKYKRLVLGKRVRLRNAYVIEAERAIKDEQGNIVAVEARVIANTLGNDPEDGIKPKGVIQWVAAHDHATFEVRLYERLFTDPAPDSGDKNFLDAINPDSLLVLKNCCGEVGLRNAVAQVSVQFEREGYFCRDAKAVDLVFNRTISLKDTWAKNDNE